MFSSSKSFFGGYDERKRRNKETYISQRSLLYIVYREGKKIYNFIESGGGRGGSTKSGRILLIRPVENHKPPVGQTISTSHSDNRLKRSIDRSIEPNSAIVQHIFVNSPR